MNGMRKGRREKQRARIELRAENGKESVVIDGYVNVTGRNSRPIPDKKGNYFIERIQPGTFRKAMKRAEEIKILLNHRWDKILGGTKTNLRLREDKIGLRAHAEIDDPEVIQAAKEKRLRGWSFDIWHPVEVRVDGESGIPVRTITDMDMKEVSLITNMRPWYEGTTVTAEMRAGKGEETFEVRAEEFEPEYIGFEDKKNYDNSNLKKIIEKYGGNV